MNKPFQTIFLIVFFLLAGFVVSSKFLASAQTSDLPQILFSQPPEIPSIAFAAKIKGNVTVDLTLNSDGKVQKTKIIEGHPFLRKATEQAVSHWQFASSTNYSIERNIRLTFVYPLLSDFFSLHNLRDVPITILPYNLEIKAKVPPPPKPSDTISYIPSNWKRGKDRCKVHGEILRKDKVEIVYGLLGYKKGYLKAEKLFFPNANTYSGGGCVIEFDVATGQVSPKFAEVLYCKKCRIALKKWLYKNRDK